MSEERKETTPNREQESKNLFAELANREMAKRHFRNYLPYSHAGVWKDTRLSRYLADTVQEFVETNTGNAYDILIIECPPQHGKSMSVTESFPSWYLGTHPLNRVIIASYNEDFASHFCRRNKDKMKTFGINLFGVTIGAVDRSEEFELDNKRGGLISRGIMSGITGNPANLVIIDDPIKNREEADSPSRRDKVWEEWQSSIKSRLAAGGKVIVILTPWHEDDLAHRMLQNEPNCKLVRIPVEAEANDPLGRVIGEALCPELGKDNNWLADFKQSYINDPKGGQRAWTALYQCSPRVEGGNLIHRDWWRFYDPEDRTLMYGTELISVDAAFKDKDTSDYVSIQVWGKRKGDYYLKYCLNQHLDFPHTIQALKTVKALNPNARTILIEDKANGSAIIQTLQHEPNMYVVPINPQGGKVSRVNAIAAAIESGHVYLPTPEKAPWVVDFIDQFTAFPNGTHDDMIDACSQALSRLIYSNGDYEPVEITEQEQQYRREIAEFNDMDMLFSPYGQSGAWGM